MMTILPLLLMLAGVKQSAVASIVKPYYIQPATLGMECCASIMTPPEHEKSPERHPVLHLIHRYGDDHTAWSK